MGLRASEVAELVLSNIDWSAGTFSVIGKSRREAKLSLWLGHEDIQTTEVYLRADPTEKLEAMSAMVPLTLKRGQFRAPDKLIASLRGG